jgi:hypothetical protein
LLRRETWAADGWDVSGCQWAHADLLVETGEANGPVT